MRWMKEITRESLRLNLLLENLRFYKEEEQNDSNFAKQLASLAEVYTG